jgi:hypothetical protein
MANDPYSYDEHDDVEWFIDDWFRRLVKQELTGLKRFSAQEHLMTTVTHEIRLLIFRKLFPKAAQTIWRWQHC